MERWIYLVHTNCRDPEREKEFNQWYDTVHLPDVLETKGFTRATRYENREPAEGEGKFLAVYELETDDIEQTMARHQENVAKKREQGRMTELVRVVSRSLYKQISGTVEGKK